MPDRKYSATEPMIDDVASGEPRAPVMPLSEEDRKKREEVYKKLKAQLDREIDLQSQLARVTAERDALSKELDAVHEAGQKEIHALRNELDQALEHLSALKRTQKLDAANFARLVKNNEALRGFAKHMCAILTPGDLCSIGPKYGIVNKRGTPTPLLTGEAEE